MYGWCFYCVFWGVGLMCDVFVYYCVVVGVLWVWLGL